jgi:hypothetical protein
MTGLPNLQPILSGKPFNRPRPDRRRVVFFMFTNSRVWKTTSAGNSTGACTIVKQPRCGWKWFGSAAVAGLPAARRFCSTPYNMSVSPTDINRVVVGAGNGFIDVTTNLGTSPAEPGDSRFCPGTSRG